MKFQSTQSSRSSATFEQALLRGYAPDGGLFLPELLPTLGKASLLKWSGLSFTELAAEVLALFVADEIPKKELVGIMNGSFDRFGHDGVLRYQPVELKGTAAGNSRVEVAELWHGPTLAFKDLALQAVAGMIAYFRTRDENAGRMTIVVGTSGDTGSAAMEAVGGHEKMDIVVLYPPERVTRLQEMQMQHAEQLHANVHLYAVEGTSDDLDVPIAEVFADTAFVDEHHLCSVNSINIGRILMQTVHYIHAYLHYFPECDGTLSFVVPTGAAGNVTAGMMCRLMGVPIDTLCMAVNENSILHRFATSGAFFPGAQGGKVHSTFSSAMDIMVPYNVERMLFYACGGDHTAVKGYMQRLKEGGFQLTSEHLSALRSLGLTSTSILTDPCKSTAASVWQRSGYLLDPHTAVGVAACGQLTQPALCVLSTAHPVKFLPFLKSTFPSQSSSQILRLVAAHPWEGHSVVSRAVLMAEDESSTSSTFTFQRQSQVDWAEQLRGIIGSL